MNLLNTVAFYTLGCKLNFSETSTIARNFVENGFKKVDYILTPSTPTTAFELGKKQDPLTMYLNDIFTVPASLAGLPGISLPVGLDQSGLPIGIQLIANAFDEPGLISTAHVLEKSADFNFIADGVAK